MKSVMALGAAVLLSSTFLLADPRQWDTQGLAVRQASHADFWNPQQTATNADGQTVVVWSDERSGNYNIYAQLLDNNGSVLWDENGLTVVDEPHSQVQARVAAVEGGFIVFWLDYRADPYRSASDPGGDVRAQKLSLSGQRLWMNYSGTGVPVDISASGIVRLLGTASDGQGGALLAWQEITEAGGYQVALQHMNAWGDATLMEPVRFSTTDAEGYYLKTAPDGDGNLLLTWLDGEGTDAVVRMCKISPAGARMWGNNGIIISPPEWNSAVIYVCADGGGGCYLASHVSSMALRLQRLSPDGQPLWGWQVIWRPQSSGILRLAASRNNTSADGLLLTLPTLTSGQAWIQKMSPEGGLPWGGNGVLICDAACHTRDVEIASDGEGGAVVVRVDNHNAEGERYTITRLDNLGYSFWDDCERPVFTGRPIEILGPPAVIPATGRITIIGFEARASAAPFPCFQMVDLATGDYLLDAAGVDLLAGIDGAAQTPLALPLTWDRVLVAWDDARGFPTRIKPYIQIVHTSGEAERINGGEPLLVLPSTPAHVPVRVASLSPDGRGGAFILLREYLLGASALRLTRLDLDGNRVGPEAGVLLAADTLSHYLSGGRLATDGAGGSFVIWRSSVGNDNSIHVHRYNAALEPQWPAPLTVNQDFWLDVFPSTPGHCLVLTAETFESYYERVNATRLNAAGDTVWSQTVIDTVRSVSPNHFAATSDGAGGCYLAWQAEATTDPGWIEILTQHLDSSGNELWPQPGLPVTADPIEQDLGAIAVDAQRHLYVSWINDYGVGAGMDLHAQRLRPDGTLCWPLEGVVLTSDQTLTSVSAAVDAHDHLAVTWQDYSVWGRLSGTQIDSLGQTTDPYWVPGQGNSIGDSLSRHMFTTLAPDSSGGVYVFYMRSAAGGMASGIPSIYGQLLADAALSGGSRESALPLRAALHPAFPNPFNPQTQLRFELPTRLDVALRIYDITGRQVAVLVDGVVEGGLHTVDFNGHRLASGIYFARLEGSGFSQTQKLVLLK